MKKILTLLAICLLLCVHGAKADTGQTLVINGETVEKAVVQITFEGDNVILHFDDETTQSADLSVVTFRLSPTDIQTVGLLREQVVGKFDIEGLAPGTPVSVYDASGRQILSTVATAATTSLKLQSLKNGVYLLKAGHQVVKFNKR